MGNYRMYEQAIKTLNENDVKSGDTINPFNNTVDSSGICPTITTRPEGFKTAILVVEETAVTGYSVEQVDGTDETVDVREFMKGGAIWAD